MELKLIIYFIITESDYPLIYHKKVHHKTSSHIDVERQGSVSYNLKTSLKFYETEAVPLTYVQITLTTRSSRHKEFSSPLTT